MSSDAYIVATAVAVPGTTVILPAGTELSIAPDDPVWPPQEVQAMLEAGLLRRPGQLEPGVRRIPTAEWNAARRRARERKAPEPEPEPEVVLAEAVAAPKPAPKAKPGPARK